MMSEQHLASYLATFGGVGKLPIAPGSWASVVALPIAWALMHGFGAVGLGIATTVVTVLGIWAADRYCDRKNQHDSSEVVIDEVAGQWLTLMPVAMLYDQLGLIDLVLALALFRFFDIVKPWPISLADRRVKGGFGVMLDDVLAGIAAGAVLLLIAQFNWLSLPTG